MRRPLLLLACLVFAVSAIIWWRQVPSTSQTEASLEISALATNPRIPRVRAPSKEEQAPASLFGHVRDAASGEGIAGATISINLRTFDGSLYGKAGERQEPIVVRSDEGGNFQILELPPGNYSLASTALNYEPQATDQLRLVGGQARRNVVLNMKRGGFVLSGTVTDIGGGAVPYAVVRGKNRSDLRVSALFRAPFSTVTREDGTYILPLGTGRYEVEVFHIDYKSDQRTLEIAGQDATADFVLTPGSVIEGVVRVRGTEEPVPDAVVTFAKMGRRRGFVVSGLTLEGGATTDASGRFSLGGIGSGAFELYATAKHASAQVPTVVEVGIAETLSDVVVYVEPAFTVSGVVVKSGDNDVPESDVMIAAYNLSPGAIIAAPSPSAKDGTFEIRGVPPGAYTIGALGEDRLPKFFGQSISVVDKDITDVVVTVDRGAIVSGRIEPPMEAQVQLTVEQDKIGPATIMATVGALMTGTRSEADGSFQLKGVGNGTFTVVATTQDGQEGRTDIEVSGDVDGVVVALKQMGSVHGQVVTSRGLPVQGVSVELDGVSDKGKLNFANISRGGKLAATTDKDGRFSLNGLADDTYAVTVDKNGQIPWADKTGDDATKPVEVVVEGAQAVRDVRLQVETQDHRIRGVVRGPNGPLVDAWVTAVYVGLEPGEESDEEDPRKRFSRWRSRHAPVLTDESGRFVIEGLKPGWYDLESEGLRGSAKGSVLNVKVDTRTTISVEVLATISGVVSKGGQPVTEYVISASGPTRRRVQVVGDDGAFSLGRLSPGTYTIRATADSGVGVAKVELKAEKEVTKNIELSAFGGITGTLVDGETQEPVSKALVVARVGAGSDNWARGMDMATGRGPKTDSAGGFRVGDLAAGKGKVFFFAPNATSFEPLAQAEFELQPGETVNVGEIKTSSPKKRNASDSEPEGTPESE